MAADTTDQNAQSTGADPSANHAPATEPSGYHGSNPSTAGPGKTELRSSTPENNAGRLNPSAPEDANITPGSAGDK